jgi:predicted kinase
MCYKPSMRKWMRERMQRRKKSQENAKSSEAPPEPLQPAYFDSETSMPEATVSEEHPQSEAVKGPREKSQPVAPEPVQAEDTKDAIEQVGGRSVAPNQASTIGIGRRRRRRRGRGGRGKGEAPPSGAMRSREPLQTSAASVKADTQAVSQLMPVAAELVPALRIPPAPSSRAAKGVVVLAIGLPGSGKSSWFKRHKITPLSSDLLRGLLFDDPQEQRFQDLVFSNLRSMLKARLIARRPLNYVDATNLTPHERHSWIKLAKDFGYDAHAVYFDVPLEVCLERNQRRHRVVEEEVMRRMAGKLRGPTFDEGFSKITVVRVKKKGL